MIKMSTETEIISLQYIYTLIISIMIRVPKRAWTNHLNMCALPLSFIQLNTIGSSISRAIRDKIFMSAVTKSTLWKLNL